MQGVRLQISPKGVSPDALLFGLSFTALAVVAAWLARQAYRAHRTTLTVIAGAFALLGALGISRLYSRAEPMLAELMAAQPGTRGRLEAMIDYIESAFAGMNAIDRQLVLLGPTAFAEDQETQREIGSSAMASFAHLIEAGRELGDVNTTFSAEMLAATVVGTLNMLTISWCLDSDYPVFAKLEEARGLFEQLICKDTQ